jgi:hypothetical protein
VTPEVESFKKIKTIIDNYNSTGEYIDLVILVNKFDDPDDDYEQIYSEIPNKTQIPAEKIFKFSSHKMLIMNMIKHKSKIYIPQNDKIKKELQKIIKNAGFLSNTGIYSTNEYVNSYYDGIPTSLVDWNKCLFIDYLKDSPVKLEKLKMESYQKYNCEIIDKILKLYSKKNSLSSPHIYIDTEPGFDDLIKIFDQINFNIFLDGKKRLVLTKILGNCANKIFNFVDEKKKYFRFICVIFDFFLFNKLSQLCHMILKKIIKNLDHINYETQAYLLYRAIEHLIFDTSVYLPLFTSVFRDSQTYSNSPEIRFYNILDKKKYECIQKIYKDDYNWYVGNTIHYLQKYGNHNQLNYLLELSKFTMNELIYLDKMKLIQYNTFDNILPNIKQNLRWISVNHNDPNCYSFYELFKNYVNDRHKELHSKLENIISNPFQNFLGDYLEKTNNQKDTIRIVDLYEGMKSWYKLNCNRRCPDIMAFRNYIQQKIPSYNKELDLLTRFKINTICNDDILNTL